MVERNISSAYPFIEAIKRSVISAFKSAVVNSFPDENLRRVAGNIEMEYPFEEEQYPGIWVRFSLGEIRRAALDARFEDLQDRYMLGFFKGRVSLEVAALSSKERDGISSGIVNMLLFGRESEFANAFFESIEAIDYLAITVQDGIISPGGQSESVSTPDEARLVYTDSYSFNIIGQWASRYDNPTQLVRLREIITIPEMVETTRTPDAVPPGTYV